MTIRTDYETLEVKVEDGVTWVTINRPKVLNALNEQVLKDLTDLVDQTVSPANSRALVITGSGETSLRCWC